MFQNWVTFRSVKGQGVTGRKGLVLKLTLEWCKSPLCSAAVTTCWGNCEHDCLMGFEMWEGIYVCTVYMYVPVTLSSWRRDDRKCMYVECGRWANDFSNFLNLLKQWRKQRLRIRLWLSEQHVIWRVGVIVGLTTLKLTQETMRDYVFIPLYPTCLWKVYFNSNLCVAVKLLFLPSENGTVPSRSRCYSTLENWVSL